MRKLKSPLGTGVLVCNALFYTGSLDWSKNIKKILDKCRFVILFLSLLGCTSADREMVGGDVAAINHIDGTAVNWFSVNGYRAHGGGGSSCCIIMPVRWRAGLKVDIEWEVDLDPYAYSKWPPLGSEGYKVAQAKHKKNYKNYSATVDIPEWPEKKSCDMNVHFLTCNRVEVTTSCSIYGQPNYPIKEPLDMKEPAVCPK